MSIRNLISVLTTTLIVMASPVCLAASETDVHFKTLTVLDGLSSNCVYCMEQDLSGFMWFGTDNGLDRYDGKVFRHYPYSAGKNQSLSDPVINCLHALSDGRLLIGTPKGLNVYDPKSDRVGLTFIEQLSGDNIRVIESYEDKLWIGTNRGLYIYDDAGAVLDSMNTANSGIIHDIVRDVYVSEDYVFIGTFDGISRFNRRNGEWKSISLKPDEVIFPENNLVLSITSSPNLQDCLLVGTQTGWCELDMDTMNYIGHNKTSDPGIINNTVKTMYPIGTDVWMGTEDGVMVVDMDNHKIHGHRYSSSGNYSLSGNIVWQIFRDSSNILWFATETGVSYCNLSTPSFKYANLSEAKGCRHVDVSAFAASASSDGKVWIGSRFGLAGYDPERNIMTYPRLSTDVPGTYNFVRGVDVGSDGLLWIATAEGIICCDEKSGRQIPVDRPSLARIKYVSDISCMQAGTVYAVSINGTIHRLEYEYSAGDSSVRLKSSFSADMDIPLYSVVEGRDYVWCASSSNSIMRFDRNDLTESDIECECLVSALFVDRSTDVLWVGTDQGLFVYDNLNGRLERRTAMREKVYSICSDTRGYIWFSTNSKICRYDSLSDNLQTWLLDNWISGNSLLTVSVALDDDVLMFGQDCMIRVSNSDIHLLPDVSRSKIILSELLVNGNDIHSLDILDRSLSEVKELHLDHDQNSLSFNFSMIDQAYSPVMNYEYILEGYESVYRQIDGKTRFAEYFYLRPGNYKLKVRAVTGSNTDHESELILKLRIERPMWNTWWAWLLYILLSCVLVLFLLKLRRRYTEVSEKLSEEISEREKIEAIDRLKNHFFTNISHDFKTPITLILSPIETMLNEETDKEKLFKLGIIQKNAYRILNLVDQILELKKSESNTMKLNLTNQDIVKTVRESCESFLEIARKRQIDLSFVSTESVLFMDFDKNCMDKIIVNLVSNAIKNTLDCGQVLVSLCRNSDGNVEVSVIDTGVGIPESDLPRIFEMFYQVESETVRKTRGSGLGLSIVKSFVEQHDGKISVSSSEHGTTFRFYIPVRNERDVQIDITEQSELVGGSEPTLLLVEDNPEMKAYLVSEFERSYNVVSFTDAESAFKYIQDSMPDIVVSDVMLPGISGLELCSRVKQDTMLSHIPFVLLSAVADEDAVVSGFEAGADEYFGKPFNMRVLMTRLEGLLAQRNNMYDNMDYDSIKISSVAKDSPDMLFINNLVEIIEENMLNVDLDMPFLCEKLAMSHISLYRKVKAITGYNVNTFIREIRLKKAAQMLRIPGYSVTDVMYDVGFNHRSYFSKCFKEYFGVSPKDYAKKYQTKENNI